MGSILPLTASLSHSPKTHPLLEISRCDMLSTYSRLVPLPYLFVSFVFFCKIVLSVPVFSPRKFDSVFYFHS
jgi:hypothetical protein